MKFDLINQTNCDKNRLGIRLTKKEINFYYTSLTPFLAISKLETQTDARYADGKQLFIKYGI